MKKRGAMWRKASKIEFNLRGALIRIGSGGELELHTVDAVYAIEE